MSRSRLALVAVTLCLAFGALVPVAVAAAPAHGVSVEVPATSAPGTLTTVTVRIAGNVSAIDGRFLAAPEGAELIGVAPLGRGTAFRPVPLRGGGGAAFGAYGLRPVDGATVLRLAVLPHRAGQLQVRIVIDAVADRAGRRVAVSGAERLVSLRVEGSGGLVGAPRATGAVTPIRTAGPTRELLHDGRIDRRDLDAVRVAWEESRQLGGTCLDDDSLDANGDGCIDVVDVQATVAALGTRTAAAAPSVAAANMTLTVVSPVDNPDAAPGNGICADSSGQCTLRAAMAEADYIAGNDRIEFALPGPAPALIQLSSRLPIISSRSGTVTIDGYTQSGSQPNTATVGSNAIPGVEIRGNGSSARETAFRITSAGNTFRGLLIDNVYRGIFIDTAGGTDNRIVGNWIGFHSDGSNAAPGNFAIVLNTGAVRNQVGTSALADKNVIGNYTHAVDEYGPGTNGNVIQGNQFCIGPTGFTLATCSSAVDHNFGPKNGLIGGTGAERNVIGPTALQGIEFSHGYNPSGPPGSDQSVTYQINGHRVAGNWVGFRGDGSYDALYRSGLSDPGSADNGQAINVYDGSNDNIVEGNWVGSVYDGIQVMSPNSQRNTVRDNIIGVSPLGEPAPLTRWGIRLRIGTKSNVIRGNTIRNAGLGGVGLTQGNVYNIRISRNIVTDTSGIGIDLFGASGPEPNDAGDGDSGANTLLNTPVITTANASTIAGTASGNATVEVFRASRPAGENGLPTEFLGSTTAASNGTWSLAVASTVGDRVTALQFRADDNTSELSTNVEVVAGPAPPQPGDLLAADDFERTVSAGWGDAPTGGSWTHRGAQSDFSVADGAGRISVAAGQSREGRLAVAAAGVNVRGTVRFDRLPSAGSLFGYALARANGNDSYRASIRVSTSGAVFVQLKRAINNVETNLGAEVATGLTLAAGTALAFRLEVVGTQLRFRVWHPGGAEPTTWHVTATDSTAALQGAGSAGLRAYVGSSVPNGPAVISLDDFEVRRG